MRIWKNLGDLKRIRRILETQGESGRVWSVICSGCFLRCEGAEDVLAGPAKVNYLPWLS